MLRQFAARPKTGRPTFVAPLRGMLQRKCACGGHVRGGGTCAKCAGEMSVQPSGLSIGSSNDPLEHEADRIAEQVLAQPTLADFTGVPLSVQRRARDSTEACAEAPASVHRALAGSGARLDMPIRRDMEVRFGCDFSQVRVHRGAVAEQAAREVGALAFTVGSDIVFGTGGFASETRAGRRLLAHELAHVVQQSGEGSGTAQQPATVRRDAADPSAAPPEEQARAARLRRSATLPHLALQAWKTLPQRDKDQILWDMTLLYGAPFTAEFLNYAKGLKKARPGLGGALKGRQYTPKWLYDHGYRHAYGEIWVHPSGEYQMVLAPAAKNEGPAAAGAGGKAADASPGDAAEGHGSSTAGSSGEYEYGGVTYRKDGSVSSYPKSMEDRCMLSCVNEEYKDADECSDCCTEKIPAQDSGCLTFCIASCQDYHD